MNKIAVYDADVARLDRDCEARVLVQQFGRVREADVAQPQLVARLVVGLDVPQPNLPGVRGHFGVDVEGHHPHGLLNLEVALDGVFDLREVVVRLKQEIARVVPVDSLRVAGGDSVEHGRPGFQGPAAR